LRPVRNFSSFLKFNLRAKNFSCNLWEFTEMDTPHDPFLPAWSLPDGIHCTAWCCHCRTWHTHGNGPGHRTAHCGSDTPYRLTGYTILMWGRAPAWVLRDRERDQPKGHAIVVKLTAPDLEPDVSLGVVVVPYAFAVVEGMLRKARAGRPFPPRWHNDIKHVLACVQAVARYRRDERARDAEGHIVATAADWKRAMRLVGRRLDPDRILPRWAAIEREMGNGHNEEHSHVA
jgi:hypothetical protein